MNTLLGGVNIKGIYIIKNIENNRVYVGETLDVVRRWTEHLQNLHDGKHNNKELQKDFNIFGKGVFEFYVETFVDESINYNQTYIKILLLLLERKTINKYKQDGYTLYNMEDSLYRVLDGSKNIYNGLKVLDKETIRSIVVNINNKLKQDLCMVGNVLYADTYKLKELYSKHQLIENNILLKVKGNKYKLNTEIVSDDDIIEGNTYSTYKINSSARTSIERFLEC